MIVRLVNWDSNFFGLKIGLLETENFNAVDFNKEKDNFELIYLQKLGNIDNGNSHIIEPYIDFSDKKIIFSKNLTEQPVLDTAISEYNLQTASKEITELALQAGEFSRFKLDKNFKNNSYEHLYTKWIENSCNKILAFCVLIYGDINNPDGFITLQKNGTFAQVGLFAVNKAVQNNGVGKKLILAAEFYAKKYNFDKLNIATQADNIKACQLYEKCGFSVEYIINTYHHWNKKNGHTF